MKWQSIGVAILFVFASNLSFSQIAEQNKKLDIDPETNCFLRYYYFPNLQSYFDLLKNEYIFKLNGEWQYAKELPQNYGGYSLYKGSRTFITDYDGEEPFLYIDLHKKQYPYSKNGIIKTKKNK